MDEQDIDDLLNIPMTPTLYWDPKGKCLKVDKEAGKVSGRKRVIVWKGRVRKWDSARLWKGVCDREWVSMRECRGD